MPTVNIYYKSKRGYSLLNKLMPDIKRYIAKELTAEEIRLASDEISVRLIHVENGKGMLGDVELEITAHEFPSRIKMSDKICHDTKAYLQGQLLTIGNVRVWLKLCKLGHDAL